MRLDFFLFNQKHIPDQRISENPSYSTHKYSQDNDQRICERASQKPS